jgi:putative redox protein
MSKPPVRATLSWIGDLRLAAKSGDISLTLDSDGMAGPSPVQALGISLAGCMGIDVVHFLTKGRHPVTSVDLELEGERAQEDPHRFLRIRLHLRVGGHVPVAAAERALQLSRDKYCSVWHSMRQDIDLITTCEVVASPGEARDEPQR